MYVFEDGTLSLLNPNCVEVASGHWRYEPRYMQLTLVNADGSETLATVLGVPWRTRIDSDGSESYIWGQHVWFDSGRYWVFTGSNTATEC